jgi:hypothetical protein
MEKVELIERAHKYVEASQRVKAAQKVLEEERDALIPAFKQLCHADENGNRMIEFGEAKISLVPQRSINYDALRKALGQDAHRFTERFAFIPLHHVVLHGGLDDVKVAEAELRELAKKFGVKCEVHENLDVEAGFAHLTKEQQDEVREITSWTLRPYPEKKGFAEKIKAAVAWLMSK